MAHTHHAPPAATPTLARHSTDAPTHSTVCAVLQVRYERLHDNAAAGLF
ncbi:hypothetical protein AB0G67_48285 [Streptomyces sp. NPDC021056]